MFCCESCNIFKNSYFKKHLRATNISYSLYQGGRNVTFILRNFAYVLNGWFPNKVNSFWLVFEIKGPISGLTQFLTAKNSLKMMKHAFYFMPKALFALKIFTFLSWLFGHVAKWLHKKHKINFKFDDVTAWLTNRL